MPGHSRSKNGVASAGLRPGHPCLRCVVTRKAWMAGTSPAMTSFGRFEARLACCRRGRVLGRIFTVGGYTLLSRVSGFARDIMLAAILGAGPAADAFFVALRLPNHFRAIFAEGAFNAAFVPAYAHVHGKGGETSAKLFANRIFTLLFVSQLVLLVVALLFMPQAMSILAPGFTDEPEQRRLAIELTRITFPYLLLITLVTL